MMIKDLIYWPSALSSYLWFERHVDESPSAVIDRWKSEIFSPSGELTVEEALIARYNAYHCIIFSLFGYGIAAMSTVGLFSFGLWLADVAPAHWHDALMYVLISLTIYSLGLMIVLGIRARDSYRAVTVFNQLSEQARSSYEFIVFNSPRNSDLIAAGFVAACFILLFLMV